MTVLGPTPPYIPIGLSDYARLREDGYTYVDKTSFVAEVLAGGATAMLVPRPRRFGKTLNISTLRYFLERDPEHDRTAIFDDTHVWAADGGRFREHFQRYPVIALSFRDVVSDSWPNMWHSIRSEIQQALQVVEQDERIAEVAARFTHDVQWLRRGIAADATPVELGEALERLSRWLHAVTGERAWILIDEYDAPLLGAHQHGFLEQALAFFKPFYTSGLKDGPHLHKAVLTGILRIAKESIFSGLNNFEVHSIVGDRMVDAFGFTETEVTELLAMADRAASAETVRSWYNGYTFGRSRTQTIYNPWSILNFLSDPSGLPAAHWKNSSSNDLVREQLLKRAADVGPDVERLIRGEAIRKTIDDNVVLRDLDHDTDVVWSLLTFSGYLTSTEANVSRGGFDCALRVPNQEVLAVFEDTFSSWLHVSAGRNGVTRLTRSMLTGDASEFEAELSRLLVAGMSHHDFKGQHTEALYQAFVVGLLVHMDPTHRVRSNREAGYGRADVLISPRTPGAGAVLELKIIDTFREETVQTALDAAVAQLRDRDYAAEVRVDGATEVHQYGVVFDGKRCWVRVV